MELLNAIMLIVRILLALVLALGIWESVAFLKTIMPYARKSKPMRALALNTGIVTCFAVLLEAISVLALPTVYQRGETWHPILALLWGIYIPTCLGYYYSALYTKQLVLTGDE